jgi:PDZ domain/PEGA domain
MRPIGRSALCLLGFATVISAFTLAQRPPALHILPGSKVVIAPMGGFETYFAAAVREKKVPIALTLDGDSAQFFIVSTETEWRGFVYGSGANANWSQNSGTYTSGAGASSTRGLEASIMLIDAQTKDIVWAYEVHKSSHGGLLFGTLAARGQQSVAEACAKHLKEFIEKEETGKANGASSVLITPIANDSTDKISSNTPTRTSSQPSQSQAPSELSRVAINSTPDGADIFVDESFAGNTPSTINISAGKHVIAVRKPGFEEWVRQMNLYVGSISLNAELTRGSDEMHAVSQPTISVTSKAPAPAGAPASSSQNSSGWIGIEGQASPDGVLVTNITAGGPGAKAGLQVGDVILALDGRLMKGKNFETAVASLKPGTQITVNYSRGSSAHETSVTVSPHSE